MNERKLQGIETKKRIMKCAHKLFREKGFNDTTVDEIIKEANSSKGGFYNHFKSKKELLFNMVPLVDEAYSGFMKRDTEFKSMVDKITSYIQYVFDIIAEDIGLEFISTIYASQIKDAEAERFLIAPERAYYQVLEKLIEEGKLKGEIKQGIDTKHTINLFTTCFRGVIYDWCLQKGEFNLSENGGEIMKIMLDHIKAEV